MATTKLALKRLLKGRNDKLDIQLTALIDIVVFLLVFLIQVVSISQIQLRLVGDIELPSSASVDAANRAITVQITKNLEVYIEDEKINLNPDQLWTAANSRIISDKLESVKNQFEEVIKKSNKIERFNLIVNLAMDKSLEYQNIKNLMDLSAHLGLIQFKFIVIE